MEWLNALRAALARHGMLALLVLLAVAATGLWQQRQAAVAAHQGAARDAAWLVNAVPSAVLPQSMAEPEPPADMMSVLSDSLVDHAVTVARVEPDGEDSVRVWFTQADFAALSGWLWQLEEEDGLLVRALVVSALPASGRVSGNVVLGTGSVP